MSIGLQKFTVLSVFPFCFHWNTARGPLRSLSGADVLKQLTFSPLQYWPITADERLLKCQVPKYMYVFWCQQRFKETGGGFWNLSAEYADPLLLFTRKPLASCTKVHREKVGDFTSQPYRICYWIEFQRLHFTQFCSKNIRSNKQQWILILTIILFIFSFNYYFRPCESKGSNV